MATLPEGRTPLTDEDMIILLNNMARSFGTRDERMEEELRQIAGRFSELSKAAGVAQHKAQQG